MTLDDSSRQGEWNGFRRVRASLVNTGGEYFKVRCQGSPDGVNWYTFQEFGFHAAWPTRRKPKATPEIGGGDEAR